jgi:hypothetical protein
MKYQVEKGIPVPSPNTRSTKYPFRDMVVGDSFVVPEKRQRMPVHMPIHGEAKTE